MIVPNVEGAAGLSSGNVVTGVVVAILILLYSCAGSGGRGCWFHNITEKKVRCSPYSVI